MSAGSVGVAIATGGAGQAIGSVVGPATEAGKGIYKSLKRKYDYIKNLKPNFENLETEARYLSSREKDVNIMIERNRVIMEKTEECDTWLKDVKQMNEDLKDVKIRYQKASNTSCGPCQLHTRLKLSKEIVKLTTSVIGLRDRMNLDHILLRERPPERVERKFPKKIDVPTLQEHVETILKYLTDDSINKVGIWGMPGVGKSTILKILNDELERLKMFDIVLWVTVSKGDALWQIQQKILKRLGVTLEPRDATALISKSLKKQKFLLLLDEVSTEIDLCDIGIYDHMPGKVVVATRERKICNFMTDEEIKVERLSRDDARKLFRYAVGEAFEHPRIKPIAEKVLRQCGELPQVIKIVGNHLKGKLNEDFWRNTLSSLQCPSMDQLEHMEEVFTAFKLIYDELHGSQKECLLYGASFPEDYEICQDYLVECWKAEQLVGINQTLRKACEEGHSNLINLTERSLFDQCKRSKYVKMPVIFRNAALRMAYHKNFGLLVIDPDEVESHPPMEKWRDAKVVSLMNSDLEELPDNPRCNRVSTLFLQKNEKLSNIPPSFFESMGTLKILDLYGTNIKTLPSSVSMLTDLRGLYLNDCHQLVELPEDIGKLYNLEILDIRRTGIRYFPMVIKELTHLQCLRVSFTSDPNSQNHVGCNGVDNPPSKIFELLLPLEELTIEADPKDPNWNKIAPEIVIQLANLRKLSALSFHFPTIESLETFTRNSIAWKNRNSKNNFRSFNLYVGAHGIHNSPQFDVSKCSGRRYLQFSDGTDTPSVIKEVLGIACVFKLIGHQSINTFSDFGIDKMECLEVCEVESCNEMIAVVGGNNAVETHAFPWLKQLQLLNLQKLEHICQGRISSDSFARLTTLKLYGCPNLSTVASWEMVKQLTNLRHLRVEKCSQVTEIFEMDTQSNDLSGALPKLMMLELVGLQALVNIHTSDSFEWQALRKVDIIECDKLVNLRLNKMNAAKLVCIRCSEHWWGALRLNDEIRAHLQAFCCFIQQN